MIIKKIGTVYYICLTQTQSEIIAISCGVIFGILAIVIISLLIVVIIRTNKKWQERRANQIKSMI